MSMDSVDDIEAAEDGWGAAVDVLKKLLDNPNNQDHWDLAKARVADLKDYCRPTCGFREYGECYEDEDTCGCPCNHEQGD